MYKYHTIDLTPFNVILHVYIGVSAEICYDIKDRFNYDILEGMKRNLGGVFSSDDVLENNYIIMIFKKKYLLHEIVHCVDALMQCIEVDSMEFRAYYVDYLFNYLKNDKIYKKSEKK